MVIRRSLSLSTPPDIDPQPAVREGDVALLDIGMAKMNGYDESPLAPRRHELSEDTMPMLTADLSIAGDIHPGALESAIPGTA